MPVPRPSHAQPPPHQTCRNTPAACQTLGYFNRTRPPVARLPDPIPFNQLVGQAEYRLKLAHLYKELQARACVYMCVCVCVCVLCLCFLL